MADANYDGRHDDVVSRLEQILRFRPRHASPAVENVLRSVNRSSRLRTPAFNYEPVYHNGLLRDALAPLRNGNGNGCEWLPLASRRTRPGLPDVCALFRFDLQFLTYLYANRTPWEEMPPDMKTDECRLVRQILFNLMPLDAGQQRAPAEIRERPGGLKGPQMVRDIVTAFSACRPSAPWMQFWIGAPGFTWEAVRDMEVNLTRDPRRPYQDTLLKIGIMAGRRVGPVGMPSARCEQLKVSLQGGVLLQNEEDGIDLLRFIGAAHRISFVSCELSAQAFVPRCAPGENDDGVLNLWATALIAYGSRAETRTMIVTGAPDADALSDRISTINPQFARAWKISAYNDEVSMDRRLF